MDGKAAVETMEDIESGVAALASESPFGCPVFHPRRCLGGAVDFAAGGHGPGNVIGCTSYRLSKPMRQWLRLRDAKCTFPNCNNHSLDNDADHILAWADGGGTGVANLGQPCPKHHRLKHNTQWSPVGATREAPPGWISASGDNTPPNTRTGNHPTGRTANHRLWIRCRRLTGDHSRPPKGMPSFRWLPR
jgi:hypothetical protein